MPGDMGALVFLDDFGIVVRVEAKIDPQFPDGKPVDPFVLQPIGVMEAPKTLVEICPGVLPAHSNDDEWIKDYVEKRGLRFWDHQQANCGRLPVVMPGFPNGVPVIIDRSGIHRPDGGVSVVPRSENRGCVLQERLYRPLREAFRVAVASQDAEKMKAFWALCRQFRQEGKLLSPWMGHDEKRKPNPEIGRFYACRLKAENKLPGF